MILQKLSQSISIRTSSKTGARRTSRPSIRSIGLGPCPYGKALPDTFVPIVASLPRSLRFKRPGFTSRNSANKPRLAVTTPLSRLLR